MTVFSLQNIRGRSIHPFCSKVKRDPLQTECTDDRNSVALCNLIRHEYPLPKMYQNFDFINNVKEGEEEYYGGSVTLADFCPFIQEFTWRSKNVIVRGSQCQFEDNNPSKSTAIDDFPFVILIVFLFYSQRPKRILRLNRMEITRNASITRTTCGKSAHVGKRVNGSTGDPVAINIAVKMVAYIFW